MTRARPYSALSLRYAPLLFVLLSTACSSVHPSAAFTAEPAQQAARPQGMVSDFAGKLTDNAKRDLESKLVKFRDSENIDIAVVTIPFDQLKGRAIEDYSLDLARKWGIGRGQDKLGLLLLIAIKPKDAQGNYGGATRLEVSRKLEGDITNDVAADIIRKMKDDEKAGRFDQAVGGAIDNIIKRLVETRHVRR